MRRALIERDILGIGEKKSKVLSWAVRKGDAAVSPSELQALLRLEGSTDRQVLEQFAVSKSPLFRREAAAMAEGQLRDDVLRSLAMDANRRVRLDARFYLKKTGFEDFVGLYEAALPSPPAVRGFGEVCDSAGLDRIAGYLRDESPIVKRAALEVVGYRDHRSSLSLVKELFYDLDPIVVFEALRTANRMSFFMDVDAAFAYMSEPSLSFAMRNARQSGVWYFSRWTRPLLIAKLIGAGVYTGNPSTALQSCAERLLKNAYPIARETVQSVLTEIDQLEGKVDVVPLCRLREVLWRELQRAIA
jgi:hypothetical protein